MNAHSAEKRNQDFDPFSLRPGSFYLLIDFSLQLHDLVLQANVKLLVALHRAGLYLQLLQLPLGHHAPVAALQVHDGPQGAAVAPPSQPAPHVLLDNHRLVLPQHLHSRKHTARGLELQATPVQVNRAP